MRMFGVLKPLPRLTVRVSDVEPLLLARFEEGEVPRVDTGVSRASPPDGLEDPLRNVVLAADLRRATAERAGVALRILVGR
jgi:hypothetical protein